MENDWKRKDNFHFKWKLVILHWNKQIYEMTRKKIGKLERDMKSCSHINHSSLQLIPKLILNKKNRLSIELWFPDLYVCISLILFLHSSFFLTKISHFPIHVFFVIMPLITSDVESIFGTFYFRLTFSFSNICYAWFPNIPNFVYETTREESLVQSVASW